MRTKELIPFTGPFTFMRRMSDEMDRMFDEFNLRRRFTPPELPTFEWTPIVELVEKDEKLYVRAELPGLTKEDVKIDVTDDLLTLQGERKQEKEEKEKGYVRTERFYGSFYRAITLPEGAKPDLAKATFKNGILEIEVPIEVKKPIAGRHVPITEGEKTEKAEKKELVGA